MKHFLEISQISQDLALRLINRALFFKRTGEYPSYTGNTLANLFYENSTRTRISFELAAYKLGINTVNLDLNSSSEKKGEVVEDTIHTLAAMGVNLFVVRHTKNGFSQAIAGSVDEGSHIINAGDGTHSHPSQALLDFMTIVENKPNLKNLKIAIVGDILHSRVANSLQSLAVLLGIKELFLVAPEEWHPTSIQFGHLTTSLQEGLHNADIVVGLRVQKERLTANAQLNLASYKQNFGLTAQALTYAKSDAMIMHPGPINRGVEIDSDVADGENSYILKQVENGVFMRMAIIELLIAPQLSFKT